MKSKLRRLLAGFVDFYISCLFGTIVFDIITLGKNKFTFVSVSTYVISAITFLVLKDSVFKNASIGKRIFKLEVVKIDKTKLTIVDIIKRNISIIVLLPVEVFLLIIDNRRIGDIWAKTSIVGDSENTGD